MSDLLAEVDEMMRQERIVKMWQDHGNKLIAFIAAVIIGTGTVSGYTAWNDSVKAQGTDALLDIISDPSFPENIDGAELDIKPSLKGIGLITAAAESLSKGENEQALALYTQAADDASMPDDLAELALLNVARLSSDPVEQRKAKLETILGNENSPWLYHAHLEAAVMFANDAQDYETAISHLNIIQDTPYLPDTLYRKARALSQVYTLKKAGNNS